MVDSLNLITTDYNGAVTPTDAYNIDIKMDDGVMNTGIVYSTKGQNYNGTTKCNNTATTYLSYASGDNYNLSDTTNSCWMFFWVVD